MFLGAGHQRLRDRMFSVALDRRGHAKHLVVGESIGGSGLHDAVRTERERACLVEHDRVQQTGLFQAASIAHEQAVPCANRGRDGGHQRDGQTQRMGTGDHEHGHYALDREAPRSTEEWPDNGGNRGGDDGDDREVERRPVRQGLGARARRLGLLDEPHDTRERGLVAGSRHLDTQRALSVDGAGDHPVARRLVHRLGLAGDHRFVDGAGPFLHDAVGGNARAGPDEQQVAALQFRDRDFLRGTGLIQPHRHIRQQLREFLESALCLVDRTHLDPVAEQHDRHQRRQLPPQVQALDNAERDQRAVKEGDGDRKRDQRHHARQAISQLVVSAADERRAAVEVHDRAEHRRDVRRPRELWCGVVEPMLDHPAPDQSGDGQQQREPELVAEARHAVAGMLVVPGMDVTFSTRAGMRRLLAVRLMILMMMIVLRHGSAFLDALMRRAPAGR